MSPGMSTLYQFPNKPVTPPARLRRRLHEGCPACKGETPARAAKRTVFIIAATAAALLLAWVIA